MPAAPTPEAGSGEPDIRDGGPAGGRRRERTRTCAVTRQVRAEGEMIRFVLDPHGRVVADLKRRLPGRGVWVSADAANVALAVRRNAFARGFRCAARADEALPEMVAAGLCASALGALGLARKAGAAVTGFAKVEGLLRAGEAACLLHAAEAASDGAGKLDRLAPPPQGSDGARAIPVYRLFAGTELDAALGGTKVMHAAVRAAPQGYTAAAALKRLADYLGTNAV